jgi:choline dehydrogenase-like flavoprotein
MEHPRDRALSLQPYSPRLFSEARFYDPDLAKDGTLICGRVGLSEGAVLTEGLPNASVTLLPKVRERSRLVDRVVGLWLCPHSSGLRGLRGGYGWSRMKEPARWLGGFSLLTNIEQYPDPENRVVLSKRKDPLGLPRAALHWRWTKEEQGTLERLRKTLAISIERSGMGKVTILEDMAPDPNACHHAGTTRMHDDPRIGVVDSHGRVHGTDNLFVAGASVFPTAGFANPTLTIVALAIRLAHFLRAAL